MLEPARGEYHDETTDSLHVPEEHAFTRIFRMTSNQISTSKKITLRLPSEALAHQLLERFVDPDSGSMSAKARSLPTLSIKQAASAPQRASAKFSTRQVEKCLKSFCVRADEMLRATRPRLPSISEIAANVLFDPIDWARTCQSVKDLSESDPLSIHGLLRATWRPRSLVEVAAKGWRDDVEEKLAKKVAPRRAKRIADAPTLEKVDKRAASALAGYLTLNDPENSGLTMREIIRKKYREQVSAGKAKRNICSRIANEVGRTDREVRRATADIRKADI